MKVYIESISDGKLERQIFYNVQKCYTEYQEHNARSFWLFLEFKEGSPNFKKFLPYGETAICYDPRYDDIIIFTDIDEE